jgi:hypothetical protein
MHFLFLFFVFLTIAKVLKRNLVYMQVHLINLMFSPDYVGVLARDWRPEDELSLLQARQPLFQGSRCLLVSVFSL